MAPLQAAMCQVQPELNLTDARAGTHIGAPQKNYCLFQLALASVGAISFVAVRWMPSGGSVTRND